MVENRPPVRKNQVPKIYFSTQVATEPPTIVCKCNNPALFDNAWQRYLLGIIRDKLPFQEVPIKLYFRQREQASQAGGGGHRTEGRAYDAVASSELEDEGFDDGDFDE